MSEMPVDKASIGSDEVMWVWMRERKERGRERARWRAGERVDSLARGTACRAVGSP